MNPNTSQQQPRTDPIVMHTIAAPMTPMIPSAIIGLRISGTNALDALTLFQAHSTAFSDTPLSLSKSTIKPRYSTYAKFQSSVSDISDDVLITYYPAPNSYTGEDTLEIFFHGNPIIIQSALDSLLSLDISGAEEGEFTKRAFLNGRIGLSEAEAVGDLINAASIPALSNSYSRMHGATRRGVESLVESIIHLSTMVEALIEFPDDTSDEADFSDINNNLYDLYSQIATLVSTYDQTRFLQTGLLITIVGKPNVGKSSLMNKVLQYDRSIVSNEAGTTRDFIREQIHISGVPVTFIDTAGIRGTSNKIEKAGIDAAYQQLESCHMIIGMFDASQTLEDEDHQLMQLIESFSEKPHIFVGNKIDLINRLDKSANTNLKVDYHITTTLQDNTSYLSIIQSIETFIQQGAITYRGNIISSSRERDVFHSSANRFKSLLGHVTEESLDTLAFELMSIKTDLSQITGLDYTEMILNNIFANFCIGK